LNWYAEYKDPGFLSPIKDRHKRRVQVRKRKERTDWFVPEEALQGFLGELKGEGDPLWFRIAFFQLHTGCRISDILALQ